MEPSGQPPVSASEFAALAAKVDRLEGELAELRAGRAQASPVRAIKPLPPPDIGFRKAEHEPPAISFENRLGSQVFSRVGIVALLIGVAAFLKLAIDNQWLRATPMSRLLGGLVIGAAIVLWSERFRRKGFPAFSYSLKAVGTGVLYLSLWAAFQLYHLLPGAVALGLMILVTAWNAWMAWAQDAELLAAYALAGGFATPLLLSTGGNHEIFLFTYLAAIDLAVVALLRFKPWARLLVGSFPATVIFFAGWYVSFFSRSGALGITAFFLTVFFALFAAVSALPKPRAAVDDEALQLLLILGNSAFVSLGFIGLLESSDEKAWLPWAMVLLAAIYLGLMRLQRNAANAGVHLALAVVFLTVAIPLKASGRWITVGWLAEGVALLWVSAWLVTQGELREYPHSAVMTSYRLLRLLGVGSLLLGFVGLVSLPYWLFNTPETAFVNTRFATALVGIVAFGLAIAIAQNAAEPKLGAKMPNMPLWPGVAALSIVAINIIAIHAVILEIESFWGAAAGLQTALSISAFLMAYGAALLALGFQQRSGFLRWQGLGLIVFTILKTFTWDVRSLSEGYRVASFLSLGVLLLGISFVYQRNWLGLRAEPAVDALKHDEAQP